MENLPINILDIGVILVFIAGGLIGLALGFVKAGLFVISWLGALVVTLLGFTTVRPYARQWIETPWIADLSGGVLLFLATLIVLFLISSLIGGWVRGSRLNALDRSLGMLAGLATTALVLAGGNIAAETVWPPDQQPGWVTSARSMPLIRQGSRILDDFIAANADLFQSRADSEKRRVRQKLDPASAVERIIDPAPQKSPRQGRPGYDKKERRDLDRLIQSSQ